MMSISLTVKTKNYADDLLSIKTALSHLESLVGEYSGYTFSEPSLKFGWTFFTLSFNSSLQNGIAEKFSDMLAKYPTGDPGQKFAKFIADYINSRGCDAKIDIIN